MLISSARSVALNSLTRSEVQETMPGSLILARLLPRMVRLGPELKCVVVYYDPETSPVVLTYRFLWERL